MHLGLDVWLTDTQFFLCAPLRVLVGCSTPFRRLLLQTMNKYMFTILFCIANFYFFATDWDMREAMGGLHTSDS